MGFKRTSDGRVFFQGTDEQSNDIRQDSARPLTGQGSSPAHTPSHAEDETPKSAPNQMQILSVLKSLNERLKSTQAERNYMRRQLEAYREVIEALEDKSEQNEKSYAKLEKAIMAGGSKSQASDASVQRTEALMKETLKGMAETRKLLVEIEDKAERANRNTSSLQRMQQDQAQKMAKSTASYAHMVKRLKATEHKQQDLSVQLEDTIAQQAKMLRKIDKVAEDRARFMRKIERIEETVLQTRDALNAKAMVLLTEQGASVSEDQTLGEALLQQEQKAEIQAQPEAAIAAQEVQAGPITDNNRSSYIQMGLAALLLAGAVGAGWFVSQQINAPVNNTAARTSQSATAPQAGRTENTQTAQSWKIERDTNAFAEQNEQTNTAVSQQAQIEQALAAIDDIGTMNVQDEQAISQLLEDNPDAVAQALNDKVEPGTPQQVTQSAQAETSVQKEPAKPAFDPSQYTPVSMDGAVKPDPALPEAIKKVEEQAFAGVPEAQHDLAAIYTAGHAGVAQNYDRASYWFRKAADNGIANARYNLGVLYHQGLGVKPNMNEAIYWYDQASELGHPEAQYNLGIAYIEGIGVTYSAEKAADNFEKAARSGVMEAAYNLGLIYENGLLGKAQPEEALLWYKTAADQGSPEATTALKQLAIALGIKLDDVNELVESMRAKNVPPASATPKAASAPPKSLIRTEPAAGDAKLVPAPTSGAEQTMINDIAQDTAAMAASAAIDPMASTEQEFEQITLAQVQEQLMRLGLYPGPADGVLGPLTSDAIRSYQSVNNLPVNGQASTDLLSHMLSYEVPDGSSLNQ